MWDICRHAWTSGLSCLRRDQLKPAELVLKAQFEAGLKAADAGEAKKNANIESGKYVSEMPVAVAGNMPWERAFELASQNELVGGDMPSSVSLTLASNHNLQLISVLGLGYPQCVSRKTLLPRYCIFLHF